MASRYLNTEQISNLLLEDEEEPFDESDDELGTGEQLVEQLDHNSDSEQSETDSEDEAESSSSEYYIGKDKQTKWFKNPPSQRTRQRAHNIVLHLPGPKGEAKNAKSQTDCFNLFFDKNVEDLILKHTNDYIDKIRTRFQRERDAKNLTGEELQAFFGLLMMSGVLRSSHLNFLDLWANDNTGIEFFSDVMTSRRFLFILRCLRFDDASSRETRLQLDKLAPVREFCDLMGENFKKHYTVSEYVTIDEQLPAFRGRFSGLVYMPSKPNKYGIKHHAMVDAKTAYLQTFEIYVGNQPDGPYKQPNDTVSIVNRLAEPIKGTGRNITLDNWYTSVPLAKDLLQHKLTLVGTLRKNKKELPSQFLPQKTSEVHSSKFGFCKDLTLVSYVPKKSKAVILLSTMHHDKAICEEDEKKPEIIKFYNMTKGGVDTNDKLCATYNVARRTKRWPMVIFFHLFNVAAINAYVIYNINNNSKTSRREFLKKTAVELVKSFKTKRAEIACLPRALKRRLQSDAEPSTSGSSSSGSKGRCHLCPRFKDRKTKTKCCKCNKFMCNEHITKVCDSCA